MAGVQEQAVYTFSTSSGGQTYRYDIVVDSQGLVSARNFRTPLGLIMDSYTSLPQVVVQDINTARDAVAQHVTEAEAVGGTVTFTGETTQAVVIAPGVLNNTSYRVAYTTPDGVSLTTSGKTTIGFTVEAPSTYGSVAVPKVVTYSVLVVTASSSTYGGTATVLAADGGAKAITFPSPMSTADYRVVLTPDGFFPVYLSVKSKAGFTIQVGYTMITASSVTVGYDVFV